MISFRTRAESGASVAIIAAIVVLVLTAAIMVFVKPPTVAGMVAGKAKARDEVQKQINELKANKKKLEGTLAALQWDLPIDQISPKALESITEFARKDHLKLIGFRPQKAVEVNGLNQVPMLIAIEGSFPSLTKFLSDLQDPKLKLGTGTIQIANSDPSTDTVSATIGMVAYRQIDKKPATKVQTNGKKEN
ncbi:MAG: type 4a pilus biogenesis protein PilO [Fimbriimonadaceae bacterium]|nr:type 4a pilus biogenesis protein PilO [Fimbriimonadaceae bacterium]